MRHYTGIDKLINSFDQALRSLVPGTTAAQRENPAVPEETQLAVSEARHVAGLMRVNHSGEVCAQALYHGQALTAKGDKYSLGFVAETERQVSLHLQHHISQLPAQDNRSRKILEQMNEDELHHRDTALNAGGVDLPMPVRMTMTAISKLMTKTSYFI